MTARRGAVVLAVVGLLSLASCSDADVDEQPSPGGTEPDTSTVRAPNGTNMGATPARRNPDHHPSRGRSAVASSTHTTTDRAAIRRPCRPRRPALELIELES